MLDLFVKMTGLPAPAEDATIVDGTPDSVLGGIAHVVIGGMGLGLGVLIGAILTLFLGLFAIGC